MNDETAICRRSLVTKCKLANIILECLLVSLWRPLVGICFDSQVSASVCEHHCNDAHDLVK